MFVFFFVKSSVVLELKKKHACVKKNQSSPFDLFLYRCCKKKIDMIRETEKSERKNELFDLNELLNEKKKKT